MCKGTWLILIEEKKNFVADTFSVTVTVLAQKVKVLKQRHHLVELVWFLLPE